jgi:MinD superfamily P-loop ATPase
MAYVITSLCIACHRCESVCPTGAITSNGHQYQISSERCNDCLGHYAVPQCWAVCPTNGGCIPEATSSARSLVKRSSNEYWDTWFNRYDALVSQLKANHQPDYWKHWFDTYSQALVKQLQTPTSVEVHP